MGRDISIAISAKENFSTAITTMRNANQAFKKDVTGLQEKLDALNRTKVTLKVDVDKAKKELKEAESQFAKTGNEASKLKLEMSNANYENARRNLSLVSDNAKQAEKDIRSLTGAVSKADNRAASAKTAASGIIGSLAASGAASLIGDTLSSMASTFVGSAYGNEASTMLSSVLSVGGMGAAIGTAIAPGIGTAIGAALGAIVGAAQGAAANFENKDDSFKSYYQDLYNSVTEAQTNSLSSGKNIAASREQNKISFSTLLGGDSQAESFLGQLVDFASKTPFEYDDLTSISKTLLAYGYKQDELIPLMTKVGDAGSALSMSTEDMKYAATALGRMQTSGKTTLEYLNPLLERGIPVWDYLSKASGKTKAEVQDMVSKGLIPGEAAAKAIADYMGSDFSGNMEKQSKTYSGLISTLTDAQNQIDNAMGKGYNETRKEGLQDQIDYLSGESGTAMQEAYNQIGQWKASLDNQKEQFERDSLEAVMSGTISSSFSDESRTRLQEMYEEYTKYAADGSEEAGAKMGALLAEAQAIAQNEYNASDGAQLALETQKTVADSIKNDTVLNEKYWDAGYQMGKQFSLGMASALRERGAQGSSDAGTAVQHLDDGSYIMNGQHYSPSGVILPYAYGLGYVPRNNYPAMLHEGERVLTASENRTYGNSGPQVMISGNSFIVREESDIEKVAREIVIQISRTYALVG